MELMIAPPEDKLEMAAARKSRIFRADLMGWGSVSSRFWPTGDTDKANRPVWIALGGSDGELVPFVANLRRGRVAEGPKQGYSRNGAGPRFEILRSVPYSWTSHRIPTPTGIETVTFGCVSDLCNFEGTGVDPSGVRMLCLTPAWYGLGQGVDVDLSAAVRVAAEVEPYRGWSDTIAARIPHIVRTMAMLDRRTTFPMMPDVAFHVRAYAALMGAGLLGEPDMGPLLPRHYSYGAQADWRLVERHEVMGRQVDMAAVWGTHEKIESALAGAVREHMQHGTN